MSTRPAPLLVCDRLRIEPGTELAAQVPDLIEQAHAEMLACLDRAVYPTAAALSASGDARGIVITPDLLNAQVLLVGVYLDGPGTQEAERQHAAAMRLLQRHRLMGV